MSSTAILEGNDSTNDSQNRLDDSTEHLERFDMHDLIVLGYAYSDMMLDTGTPESTIARTRENSITFYQELKNRFSIDSKNHYFINEYIMIAMTYAHYIRSARRKLEEERQFCAEKRNLALQLETGMSWINSLLKLSGQLVLIGGLSGIVS